MNLFFVHPEDLQEKTFTLRGQESHHASRVLRMNTGDEIHLTDGSGHALLGVIETMGRSDLSGSILQKEFLPWEGAELILALGLIRKRDRLEFAVEKAVELGVRKIILFQSDHTEKAPLKLNRLELIAQSAMKQSLRFYLPEIEYRNNLEEVLKSGRYDHMFIAHEKADSDQEINDHPSKGSVLLLVGPEGGFSESEVRLALAEGAEMISLGKHRLRAETAAITMISRFT